MQITIKNEITGLFNTIDFTLFEQFNNQNEYMHYLLHAMNINMDSILHIKSKTQQYFANEHVKIYLFENGFLEEAMKSTTIKKLAHLEYCEMMSSICIEACLIHYKNTLKPDLIRRKKLADEYAQNFLSSLNEKKS